MFSVLRVLLSKESVVTGRGLSRGVPEGLDWRFWFKEALDEMHVVLTRLARTTTRMVAIGLPICFILTDVHG